MSTNERIELADYFRQAVIDQEARIAAIWAELDRESAILKNLKDAHVAAESIVFIAGDDRERIAS